MGIGGWGRDREMGAALSMMVSVYRAMSYSVTTSMRNNSMHLKVLQPMVWSTQLRPATGLGYKNACEGESTETGVTDRKQVSWWKSKERGLMKRQNEKGINVVGVWKALLCCRSTMRGGVVTTPN